MELRKKWGGDKNQVEQLVYEQYRNHQYHLKDSAQHSQFPELS
ncbi:unnamed protein product [marine sediment metagenome]|uniref:Uncharacterized protein n=1 Tax=marine sediment metagenome TaxID=412755 RepID=X1MIN9_9ZZZZ